jgi:hypothetical protein
MRATLTAHPATPCEFIDSFDVWVERTAKTTLLVRYVLEGETARILLPPLAPAVRTDQLWEHTCFETFTRQSGRRSYCELNFSPVGAWAAYRFSDYRLDMKELDLNTVPTIGFSMDAKRLEIDARVELPFGGDTDDALMLALAAVIEDQDRGKSYWALVHPNTKPDFHHLDAFALAVRREG